MRRKIFGAVLIAALSVPVCATAADYNAGTNTVSTDGSYKTVLITKSGVTEIKESDIVYVNQAESTVSGALSFMLKEGAEPGEYTINLGGIDGNVNKVNFTINDSSQNPEDIAMTSAETSAPENGTVRKAFTVDINDIGKYSAIKFTYTVNNETFEASFSLTELYGTSLAGSGSARMAVQVNGIPEQISDSFSAALSAE